MLNILHWLDHVANCQIWKKCDSLQDPLEVFHENIYDLKAEVTYLKFFMLLSIQSNTIQILEAEDILLFFKLHPLICFKVKGNYTL